MAAPSPFRPLASQLLTRIVWLAMGCALIVALLQSWQVYETEQNRFRALLDDIGQTHVPILTLLLWDIETDALQRHLEQLAKRPEIASVTLRSATGMQFQAGAPTPAPPSDARLTIPHPGGHAEPLGELFIQYERNVLYRTLLHAVSRTVIELAVFTTLICLVVIRVLHTQLNVYLRRITHYVNGLDPRTPPLPLDLRRPKRPWCDEIDLIAEGFARLGLSMAHYEAQRNQAISDLAAQRDALDTRVEERTAELQRMTEHLEILSRSDPLTTLANRRHFDEVKRLEARRMQRSGQP
ncbi:MAG: hypothetical protein LPK85_13920, partial [Gammaproteobacteria bacterium]|nr:hypothetical protein [Gammaproteobacteria bacterium]